MCVCEYISYYRMSNPSFPIATILYLSLPPLHLSRHHYPQMKSTLSSLHIVLTIPKGSLPSPLSYLLSPSHHHYPRKKSILTDPLSPSRHHYPQMKSALTSLPSPPSTHHPYPIRTQAVADDVWDADALLVLECLARMANASSGGSAVPCSKVSEVI